MANFSKAISYILNGGRAKRSTVKNDTTIISYKNRLYHLAETGIRYSFRPSDTDIHAQDWILIIKISLEKEDAKWLSSLCLVLSSDNEYSQEEQLFFSSLCPLLSPNESDVYEIPLGDNEEKHVSELVLAVQERGNDKIHHVLQQVYDMI